MAVDAVFVAGAGTMGAGIAQAFAAGGRQVLLFDAVEGVAEAAKPRMAKGLQKVVDKGKMTPGDVDALLARISVVESLEAVADAQFAIEAIVEDIRIKGELLAALNGLCCAETILATNTSSLSVTDLAQASGRAQRFVGMHFFNPAPIMPLVEVIATPATGADTLDVTMSLAREIGKQPVLVKDSPGFIVNRLLIPMLNEAALLLSEGVASAEDIDTAMKLGCGFPMGPLELSDLVGNDITLAVMESLHERLADDKYAPVGLLREMVKDGRLGRKTGDGFTTAG